MADDFYTPTAVCQEALDAADVRFTLGDIQDGSDTSQVLLRAYTTCLSQMLRAANWDFARKEYPLQIVADASGQTTGAGTLVPGGFLYSYSYPTDCQKVRFIPWNNYNTDPPIPSSNIVPPDSGVPIIPNLGPPALGNRLRPSRFLISNEVNYIPSGASNQLPGISPIGQKVICSNVLDARCVYTFDATWPNLWDSMFREGLVSYIAAQTVLRLSVKGDRSALGARERNIAIAQDKVRQARATNGNETWADSGLAVDWMRFRISGGSVGAWGSGWGTGPGHLFGGYDDLYFGTGNSSAY
jgi:hypothetical protein